jgi:hypothetical protein
MADEIGPYEKWPGFQRLKQRLDAFMAVHNLKPDTWIEVWITWTREQFDFATRIVGRQPQLICPKDKNEFIKSGHQIRLSFTAGTDKSEKFLTQLPEFTRANVHRVSIWANSGPSNNVSSIYTAMALNDRNGEITLQSLGENRYELGFTTSGNLFDVLLLSDELQFSPSG